MSRILAALTAGIVFSSCVLAQTATGILQGRVTDPSGASVAESTVTVENQRTGVKQILKSNSEGKFIQTYLIPSEYRVTVEKEGFQKFQTTDVRVDVQKTVDLDIALKVGAVADTIEVKADAVQLSTSTSSVSTVINRQAMLDLPLNGRSPFNLVNLTPGVTGTGANPSISGGRGGTNEITVDGTTVVVPENNVSTNDLGYQPIVDSIEEFSVITNALSAEYGRTGGGVINVASRGGSNTFHGSLFEFVRNDKLDANSWTNNKNNAKKNPLRRNQYGGSIGGPISIPHLYSGKNRTFFFFSEQETTTHQFASNTATVPTADWRAGNFAGLKNGSNQAITLYNPFDTYCATACGTASATYKRNPFPNNVIPANLISPAAKKFLSYFPLPNNTANQTNPYTMQNNFFNAGSSVNDDHKFDSRVDHNFSQAFRLWVRGSYERNPQVPLNLYNNLATTGDGPQLGVNYNTALNAVYTINPTTILSFNYGLARKVVRRDPFSQGIDLTSLGLPQAVYAQAATQNLEFPRINFGGNTNISSLGQSTFTALRIQSYDHEFRSDLTKVLTAHTLKTGVQYRKLFINFRQNGQPSGQFNFDNSLWTQENVSNQSSTTQGNGFANFLLGLMNPSLAGATGSGGTTEHTFSSAESSAYMGFYAQDDWKVNRKLTLNIGLRWEADIPRTERYNRLTYFDLDAPSPIAGKVPGYANLKGAMMFVGTANSKYGRHQAPTDLNNWGPRFGFAYSVNEKTVVRGAYAMMYAGSVQQAAGTSGSSGTTGFSSNTGINTSFDGLSVVASLDNPFPSGFNLPLGPADGPTSGRFTSLGLGVGGDGTLFTDYQNPAIQQWNANIQRELPGSFVVELGYLGSKGNHILDNETGSVYNQLPSSALALGDQLKATVANPFYGIITNPSSGLSKPTVSYNQLLRPYPQYTDINAYRKPGGNSLYHAMTISVQKRYSHGLNLQVSFTGGKSIDDTSSQPQGNNQNGSKQDGYNRAADRSLSAFDISRRLVISANYELPFGKGRTFLNNANRIVDATLGGWQFNTIYTLQNGVPLQVQSGATNTTNIFSPGQRLNNNGKSPAIDGEGTAAQCPGAGASLSQGRCLFDTTVFSLAPAYTFGNVGRVIPDVRNAGTNLMDASLFKDFRIREGVKLRFQTEAFAATNHPIWGNPGNSFSTPGTFGLTTQKNGGGTTNRQMQLALRLNF